MCIRDRALQALAPLKIAPDPAFLQIRLDQAELAATPQIAALEPAASAFCFVATAASSVAI